jgi:vacuolar-type H+-ATPase subunit E/Vma4
MSDSQGGNRRKALIEGIAAEAEEEVEKIRREADQQANEIVRGAREKAEDIRRQAAERAEQQAESLRDAKRQEVEAEQRKAHLRAKEQLYHEAMDGIRRRIEALRSEEGYREVLAGWVAEAALGLEAGELILNGGDRERELADGDFLREAEEEIRRAGGGDVSLSLSEEAPLSEPGVVLSSRDGRVVFNNRLSARLERYGSRLRRMIYRHIEQQEQTQDEGNG